MLTTKAPCFVKAWCQQQNQLKTFIQNASYEQPVYGLILVVSI